MEIILSVLFLLGFYLYYRWLDGKTSEYCNSHSVDWRKENEDRIMNNLSNSQVNRNILNGKYNSGKIKTVTEIKREQNATWEDFKKRHPHGSWN